jgi:DNA-binding SARP family transcriptional activator
VRAVEFRVLGSFEAVADGRLLEVGGPQLLTALAVLVVAAGRTVSLPALVGQLWGERLPPDAARTARTYVSRLRKALVPAGGRIETRAPGYVLRLDPDDVDAARFERLASVGRQALRAGQPAVAAGRLTAALGLWRGDAYGEFDGTPALRAEGDRLRRIRLAALEDRIEAELAAGLGPELETLVERHPGHERLWGLLMTALYRAGRQVDALAAFRRARTRLADSSGVLPSPALTELHRQVLAQDDARLLPLRAARPARPPAQAHPFAVRPGPPGRQDAGAGQLYVDLTGPAGAPPVAPVEALARLLRSLGVEVGRVPPEVERAAAVYRTLLTDRQALVLVDGSLGGPPPRTRP